MTVEYGFTDYLVMEIVVVKVKWDGVDIRVSNGSSKEHIQKSRENTMEFD